MTPSPPAPSSLHRERAIFGLMVLGALFIGALVVCNLIAAKFTVLSLGFREFTVSVGILPYPLTFLITDVISEVYGRKRANQIVVSGFAASVMVWGILALALPFPSIPAGVDAESFGAVFGKSGRVILASMTAYLVAQLVDVKVFHFWKGVTDGRHLWLRNNASTIFSQLVDTVLVVTVLFVGIWDIGQIGNAVLDGWLFKMLCALVDTPLCYLAVGGMRNWLGLAEHQEVSL